MNADTGKSYVIITIVMSVFVCLLVSLFLFRGYSLATYPYPLENGEGICMHMARLFWSGDLYRDMSSFPLIVANYPPVFFMLNFISVDSNPFLVGRIISILSILGSACVLFLAVRRELGCNFSALFTSACFLTLPWVVRGGIVCRVDMLGAFFSLAGFFYFIKNDKRSYIVAFIFLMMSLYTKHSLLTAPLACGLLMFRKDKKQAIHYCGVFIGVGLVIFGVLTALTKGHFYRHLITYNAYSYDIDRLVFHIKDFMRITGILWLMALPSLLMRPFWKSPFIVYGIGALLSLFLTGRAGASHHYFFEATFGLCLMSGYGVHAICKDPHALIRYVAAIMLVCAYILFTRHPLQLFKVPEMRRRIDQLTVSAIRNEKGPVIAEDIGFILAAGKTVYLHPFAISKLIQQGSLNPDFLYSHLHKRYFSMYVLDSPVEKLSPITRVRFTDEFFAVIQHWYKKDAQFASRTIYVRK